MIDEAADAMLAAAREQFKEARGTELQFVEVPEWPVNGQPGKIYYFPRPNLDEWIAVERHVDERGKIDPEVWVTCLILFARDSKGRRIFGEHARKDLKQSFDPSVVRRIVAAMGVFQRVYSGEGGLDEGKPDSSDPSPSETSPTSA